MKNIGSNLAIVLGIISAIAGLTQLNVSLANAGFVMIIGAFAYKSAKRRALGEVVSSNLRKATELVALVVIILLIGLQNNLVDLLSTDPVPNLIIPAWALIAYALAYFKAR